MKSLNKKTVFSISLFLACSAFFAETKLMTRHSMQELHLAANMDGNKILSTAHYAIQNSNVDKLNKYKLFESKATIEDSVKINTQYPELAKIWNSTVLVFGAASQGVGIGSGFAVKADAAGNMYFFTSFHVVESFCYVPAEINSDIDTAADSKFPCQNLFALHDLSIDTENNIAAVDGEHPWKTSIRSLNFFDKKRDLAAFKITIPQGNTIEPVQVETNYELTKILVNEGTAEKLNPSTQPTLVDGEKKQAIPALALFVAAYSMPDVSVQNSPDSTWLKKRWYKGASTGINTYENIKKLGFVYAFGHNIDVLPGTSGGALALSDGRVLAINTSVETTEYYVQTGFWFWMRNTLETYKSYYAMPSVFIKDPMDLLN